MPYSRRERIGYWLERHVPLTLLAVLGVLRWDSDCPDGRARFVNRLNHHLVVF